MEKLEWPHLTAKSPIQIKVEKAYGKQYAYPVCKDSHIFASLAGKETLGEIVDGTTEILKKIKSLGYDIEVVAEQLDI